MEAKGRVGLLAATSVNMISMIGVGPFITLPLMVKYMHGPHVIYAWLVGALLAACDGLVYAHFAGALPGTGGPYVYLREAWKPLGIGRLMAFVFIFQMLLVGPLNIASGAIGFADYIQAYGVHLTGLQHNLIAAGLCIFMTALLWRNIESAGRLSAIMLGGVLITMAWVIVAGLTHFSWSQAFTFPAEAHSMNPDLMKHIAAVSLLAMYNYMGYSTVCYLGDEVDRPHQIMPRAIMLSIIAVVSLYILFSTVVLGTLDWHQVRDTTQVAAVFVGAVYRDPATAWYASKLMVTMILFVTATALYAFILGVSRIPYAAACDGQFFRIFSKTHPTLGFPSVSLLAVGLSAVPFCFMTLGDVVNWLMLVQIVAQFIWQCAGIMMLQSLRKDVRKPYQMALYPIPALVSLMIWTGIFLTGDWPGQRFALIFLAVAVVAGLVYERLHPQLEASG